MAIRDKAGLRAQIRGSRPARVLERALLLLLDAIPRPATSTAEQALSGAGAVNLTSYHTKWTTTGADAGTLAAGAFIGQRKAITMVADGGDGTLTLALASGDNTITFADVGDHVELEWNGEAWYLLTSINLADGITAPAVSTV